MVNNGMTVKFRIAQEWLFRDWITRDGQNSTFMMGLSVVIFYCILHQQLISLKPYAKNLYTSALWYFIYSLSGIFVMQMVMTMNGYINVAVAIGLTLGYGIQQKYEQASQIISEVPPESCAKHLEFQISDYKIHKQKKNHYLFYLFLKIMPRGGRSSSRGPSPTRSTATRQAPQPTHQAPPQTASKPGLFSGFGSTLVQGMAFGAGSEVAHQAVRSVIGGGMTFKFKIFYIGSHAQPAEQAQSQPQVQQQQNYCTNEQTMFTSCLKMQNDIAQCQTYMDMFKECQKRYQ
ncbi:hypothetical protein pb186bvf_008991 [Paramecium bursaria]